MALTFLEQQFGTNYNAPKSSSYKFSENTGNDANIYNRYGEVIGRSPTGKGYVDYNDNASGLQGGWGSSGPTYEKGNSVLNGRGVNLLSGFVNGLPKADKWGNPLLGEDSGGGGTGGSGYTPQVDPYQSIRDIFRQRREAAQSNINTTYGNQISGYNAQKPLQQQQAQTERGILDTQFNTQALPSIYVAAEAAGYNRGGEQLKQILGANTSRTQGMVDIGNTEMNNLAKLDEAIRQAEAEKAAKLTQSDATLTAEEEQAIIDAMNQAQADALNVAQLTGTYTDPATNVGVPTLAAQQYKTNQAKNARQEIIDTIGAYSADYQARYNQIANDGDPTNDWQLPYIQQARQEKLAGQASASEKKAQQDFENNLKLKQFNLSQQKATASGNKTAKIPNYTANAALQNLGNASQIQSYYDYKDAFLNMDPQTAYKNMTSSDTQRTLNNSMGGALYNKLLAEITGSAKTDTSSNKSNSTLYNSLYKTALSYSNNPNYSEDDVYALIENTQGLTAEEKQAIYNSIYQ